VTTSIVYRYARYGSIIAFLKTIQLPKDSMSILSWHLMWLENRFPWGNRSTGTIEAVFACGVRGDETDREKLSRVRQSLLKIEDYPLKTIISRLKRPEICSPETYQELIRTPRMQQRLLALGLIKKPVSEREKRREEVERQTNAVSRLMSMDGARSCSPPASRETGGIRLVDWCGNARIEGESAIFGWVPTGSQPKEIMEIVVQIAGNAG
jgi:hypothetical protein